MDTVKQRVLEHLERSRGSYLSGEDLARLLGLSRTSVWKAIRELREDGCRIEASTNRGYRLSPESNFLSLQALLPYLRDPGQAQRIHILSLTESTNLTAKKLALEGAPDGTVVVADEQFAGRGRQGRGFFSPPGSGLYMSVLLRRPLHVSDAGLLTTGAAVAVCRAVCAVTGRQLQIKWVNDLLLEGKKVCGILTEAINDFESGQVECAVIGVGINISTPDRDFPPELQAVATSLSPNSGDGSLRCRLAAAVLEELLRTDWSDPGLLEEYRNRCCVLGKPITVSGPSPYRAVAREVDDSGALVVQRESGECVVLRSGEISILSE